MKLLEEFKKQIKELSDIKRIWFTSFNLSIDFFETHVLPVILNEDIPKVRQDYEKLQQEINDRQIDIRIFADRRMLQTTEIKRTSVPAYGVSNKVFDKESINEGLFHPKVIYIQDKDDRIVVGTGSANLTLSGWARNQEVFKFSRVSTNEHAEQIRSFFNPLFKKYCLNEKQLEIPRSNFGSETDWEFCHSFAEKKFLENFKNCRELTVWSPYFPKDLSGFITSLGKSVGSKHIKVNLVPDLMDGKQIRTKWSSSLEELITQSKVGFYANPQKAHDSTELNHGKLWISDEYVALGSWNFTGPGTNSLLEKNNVEAGIIFKKNLIDDFELAKKLKVDSSWFMSEEALKEESLTIDEDLPFNIDVLFDWQSFKYEITVTWFESTSTEYRLSIPDIEEVVVLKNEGESNLIIAVEDPKQLLINHYYDISQGDRTLFKGLILEKHPDKRRIQGFETIDDLLDSLITGRELVTDGTTKLRKELLSEENVDDIEEQTVELSSEAHSSYFRLFQALNAFKERLGKVKKNYDELNKHAFVYPGCLKELQEKILLTNTNGVGDVYKWFLCNEYNVLVNLCKQSFEENNDLDRWQSLVLPIPGLPQSVPEAFVEMVKEEYSHG